MDFVNNYYFDNMSRIGNDYCFQDQNTIQNMKSCNYSSAFYHHHFYYQFYIILMI